MHDRFVSVCRTSTWACSRGTSSRCTSTRPWRRSSRRCCSRSARPGGWPRASCRSPRRSTGRTWSRCSPRCSPRDRSRIMAAAASSSEFCTSQSLQSPLFLLRFKAGLCYSTKSSNASHCVWAYVCLSPLCHALYVLRPYWLTTHRVCDRVLQVPRLHMAPHLYCSTSNITLLSP